MSGNVEIVELTRTIRRQMEPGLAAAVSEAKQVADEIRRQLSATGES